MRKKRRNNVMYLSQIYTEHGKGWGTNFSSPFSYIFIFCSMFLRCFFAVSLLIFCFFLVFVVSLVSTFFASSSCFSVSHRLIPICHMFFLYILLSPPWLVQCSCRQQLYFLFCGLRPFFIFVYTVFPLGVLYLNTRNRHLTGVVIACNLESIRPGLAQGCKAPNGVGQACLITSLESGLTH